MVHIPEGIFVDVIQRLGKEGFRELGAIIASSPDGRKAVFDPVVLREADLDEFIFVSSLANEGSRYRHFFVKCFDAGNLTDTYVEGVRMAVKNGPSVRSLQLLHSTENENLYASFAYAIFSICNGNYEDGVLAMEMLCSKVGWLDTLVQIGDAVMSSVADIGPPMNGTYNATFRYPTGDIPNCVHFACNMHDVCFDCIAYWYSRRVLLVC